MMHLILFHVCSSLCLCCIHLPVLYSLVQNEMAAFQQKLLLKRDRADKMLLRKQIEEGGHELAKIDGMGDADILKDAKEGQFTHSKKTNTVS